VLAYQVQGYEFKPQYKERKEGRKEGRKERYTVMILNMKIRKKNEQA
jgi:hypothetical protein